MRRIAMIVAFIALISVLIVSMYSIGRKSSKEEKQYKASESEIAFDFNLKELGTSNYVKLSNFRGKPVFIDFWASWCPPCRQSAPYIEKLYTEFKGEVKVIGINLDRNVSSAMDFLKKNSIKFLQLEGHGEDVSAKYRVRGIPAFFIIDSDGNIVKKYSGYSPAYYNEWVKVLKNLIE